MRALAKQIPLVGQLRGYTASTARRDLQAGIVLSALLVPAGMGYAVASGLPPVTGLYATIVPLVVYALVGPSRVLVFGPDSSLAPLIAGVVIPLAANDPGEAVALAGMLSIVAGAICIVAGLARFGFLADLLSTPVRYGYLNGIALTVLVGQIPKALGFSGSAENLGDAIADVWRGVADGLVEWWPVALSAGSLAVILGLRRIDRRIPGALVAVVGGILVVVLFGLDDQVSVVGELPSGFPTPAWPDVDATHLPTLFGAALGVAFVSFADTSVLSRTFALKRGDKVDPNRELVALGAVNVAAGLTQGFAVSSSQSRTPVAADAGAATQVTGLVGAAVVLTLVLAAPGALADLPQATLAAIVIAAALRLMEFRGMAQLARARRSEFVLAVASFLAVAFTGPIVGIGIAIALSLLNFMRKAWRPHTTQLVRVDGLKGYHDAERHPEGRQVPGLLLYRFDAPLFFANSGWFEEDVMRRVERAGDVRWVVVTAEPITDVDSTAADGLDELLDRLDERGIRLAFAELKGVVRDQLGAFGLLERLPPDRFYRTIGEAVHHYVNDSGVPWRDWEDRGGPDDGGPDNGATPPA